jgi:hypothetical protein
MGFDALPPELVDRIIDHLHDHQVSLKACALTCRTWRFASQYHFFKTVGLPGEGRAEELLDIVIRSPSVARLVEQVAFRDIRVSQPWMGNSVTLPILAGYLPSVNRVSITLALGSSPFQWDWPPFSGFTGVEALSIMTVGSNHRNVDQPVR